MSYVRSIVDLSDRAFLRKLLGKQLVPIGMFLAIGALIVSAVQEVDLASVLEQVSMIAPHQWFLAVIGVALSFLAMARMEVVVHRFLDTGVQDSQAKLAGMVGVATAQTLGFGLLSGTLARWRMLGGDSLWRAAQITVVVSVAFMVALGIVTAMMVLLTGVDYPWARTMAVSGLVLLLGFVGATVWKPRVILGKHLPPLRSQVRFFGFTFLDTLAAALTLYALIPEGQMPPPALFYTAFLVSMGLGLLGTTPGGVGPFEFAMLTCLPMMPEASILAAIMGYRIVYFALPAGLAICVLLLAPLLRFRPESGGRARVRSLQSGVRPIAATALSYNAARAEAGLIRQGEFDLLVDATGRSLSLVAPTGQSLIMHADPLSKGLSAPETLRALAAAAKDRMLSPCLYKCDARTAAAARQEGWRVLHVANEAVLSPARYDLNQPSRRQLRRHLRKAETAGVTIQEAGPLAPLTDMRAVAEAWAAHRHGERGFSMGQFDDAYVSAQRIYLAHLRGRLIGFVSFHESWRERTLDLMCYHANTPTGTTHALLHAALVAAKQDQVDRLSLAAVPCMAETLPLPAPLKRRARKVIGGEGLHRFKSSFAPDWEPLYMAAPTLLGLGLASIDLVDRITRPRSVLCPNMYPDS